MCGHGLTSRPRESASEVFLDELLQLFQYPPRSAGTLPLGSCAVRFASTITTWRLPVSGHVCGLVTADPGVADDGGVEVASQGGSLGWWFWTRTEKNTTEQKNSCTPRGVCGSISSTGVEEIASCGAFTCFQC